MRQTMWAALAAGAVLVGGSAVWANDIVRLGGPSAESSMQADTDTELARWGRGGFGRGGGFYGGRGYYGGNFGRSYYGGFYGRSYYQPFAYSYYPTYSYYRPYYYSSYYYPCAGDTEFVTTYAVQQFQQPVQQQQQYVPPMPPASSLNQGPYQYDGGPKAPVPMPSQDVNPTRRPGGIIPLDGRLVSMPTATSGGTSQVSTAPRPATTSAPRVTYPAYGEEPISAVPFKR